MPPFANQVLAIIWVALRRLRTQRGLALATATGLLIAIALTMSIPLYADATLFRLLRERCKGRLPVQTSGFLLHIKHFRINPQWQDTRQADEYMSVAAWLRCIYRAQCALCSNGCFKLSHYDPQQPQTSISCAF
jgi:hypothetical protein